MKKRKFYYDKKQGWIYEEKGSRTIAVIRLPAFQKKEALMILNDKKQN